MNQPDHNDDPKELRRKLLRIQILEAPGPILIGLAIYGKYAMGNAFHPMLNDSTFTTGMLVVGGVIIVLFLPQFIRLAMRISALERDAKVKGK
jgi:hypothetical protein